MNLDIREIDRCFYAEHLKDFLPRNIIDIHTHVYLKETANSGSVADKRLVSWTSLVAEDNPVEDLLETYRLMFPGKQVLPCVFPWVEPVDKIDELNSYTRSVAHAHRLPVLFLAHPACPAEELERRLAGGGYCGIKVYLSFAPAHIAGDDVCIFDFLTHEHLAVLDRLGLMVMLHIPRPGRLKDPVNLAQILEIEQKYPNMKLVLAHIGRAYCREDIGTGFDVLSRTERLMFDCSANMNAWVFAKALEAVGPGRMLFGSDLPITRMRMRRICENGTYINLVPPGMYGDVSGDRHMREVAGAEAAGLSFFLYEELLAMKEAVSDLGLSGADVEAVFHGNAAAILKSTGFALDDAGRGPS
jgi:predicted TIM-barrel fold metal-dependent hydrolase